MNKADLQRIAGSRLSDAELIASVLDDACLLRGSIKESAELIKEALNALGLERLS